ncbi:MAG TPA: SusF/SusE family outer membrane protein [Prolixibacteraceae bacterium]|nr:SusF/SusE family outer membrane protein [Prolixibacteraceae bacterium]
MKRKMINRILAVLVIATIFFGACTKEKSNVRLAPTLATTQVLDIRSDSATVVGFVVAEGDGYIEKGVCYNTATAPTISNSKVAYTGQTTSAAFKVKLSGLAYATKYYARAYATNAAGTIYGEEYTFTTLPVVPTLTTAAITAITGNSAAGGGNVTVIGGAEVTARGVCFGIAHNPTIADGKTSNDKGAGAFESALTSLKGNTVYYVRAYATNSAGTGYGPEVTFTTLIDMPVVTSTVVTGITKISAISGGEVTYNGGGTISARGLAWSTSANPTIAGTVIAGGSGTGVFVSNLTGLTKFITYHVRAYATNSVGTAYGADVTFTTLSDLRTWNISGDYVAASYPGSTLADWAPDKSPQVKSTITSPDNLEGYVYMKNASNGWKFASQPNWDGPNYGDGGAGKLDANGGNFSSPAGYYKINVNAGVDPMTYTAVATTWGVIGDASPNAWTDETGITYDPTSSTWKGGMTMIAGGFKFRANHSWDYNYGSTSKDANLNAGGDNIAMAFAADYFITLDLSHPNAYTYSANRWGLIGSATAGGWDSDQNLTWDATNKVLKITADLVVGEIKFRANDAWDLALGGTVDALTTSGGNLAIAAAGNYTITLDLSKATYSCTITQN